MASSKEVTQDFLDSVQYQPESILQYERVYGEDFVSPGGKALAQEMIGRLELAPGSRVLDVGCGLGGSAFVMAREFDLKVDGIDLSKNMLEIANRKLAAYGLAEQVNLEWKDCLQLDCDGFYDAIYSRDVFLHIHDKSRLFSVLHAALRTGGRLLFTDYCCGPKPWSDEFTDYVRDREYDLHTPEAYAGLIENAGFRSVIGEDISARFTELLQAETARIAEAGLEASVREKLLDSWQQKIERSKTGDQRWGFFTAVK